MPQWGDIPAKGRGLLLPGQNADQLNLLDPPLGFQIILPERRNISQPLNDGGKMLDDVIHFFFRVVGGEAEADRPVSRGERNPHGPEDVRRVE